MGGWVTKGRCGSSIAAVMLLSAMVPPGASAAVVPGSNVERTDQLHGGRYMVWLDGSRPWVTCSAKLRIPPSETVLDLRTMRSRDLFSGSDLASIDVTNIDRQGRAIATRHSCDGSVTQGRVDLATGAFTDYSSLPEAQPLSEVTGPYGEPATHGIEVAQFVEGEAIQIAALGLGDPWSISQYRVTRIDFTSGRIRTRTFDREVLNQFDTLARAANGDLVWASFNEQGGQSVDPCSRRAKVRRWSYETGRVTTTTPSLAGYLPARAVVRAISTCWGELDPDTGRLYRPFRKYDYVTWDMKCAALNGMRIRGCSPYTAYSSTTERCCIRVHDTTTNAVRVLPPARSGPWQKIVTVTPGIVVWNTTTGYKNDIVTGPLHYQRLSRLRPAVTSQVRRNGRNLTIGWSAFATRFRTNIAMQVGLDSWGQPKFHFLSGLRRLGTGDCRPPYEFRTNAPSGYATCRPRINSRRGAITFVDRPGRQRYFVDAGGFMSNPIVR